MKRLLAIPSVIVISLGLLFLFTGCATLSGQKAKDDAYKALAGMALTYDTAMKTLAQLEKDGLLTPEERRSAIQAATVFWSAWHEAAIGLEIWMNVDSPEANDKVKELLERVVASYTEMMKYLEPLLQRAGR